MKHLRENWVLYAIMVMVAVGLIQGLVRQSASVKPLADSPVTKDTIWHPPSIWVDETPKGPQWDQVVYGESLITNTADYFGPRGRLAQVTNGMNCQNCHLDAGRKPWGNNFGAVAATYPRFRDRSGSIEQVHERVNDCFQRSLNGRAIDSNSKEMQAIIAYMHWLGKDVPKDILMQGVGIVQLAYLNRPASPEKGKQVYQISCITCHGADGSGQFEADGIGYRYPPLWGPNSYNTGAGLFRIGKLAGFIKDNMPFNQASHAQPALTDEACWDLAAYINSQPRPKMNVTKDWPDISKKPVDYPFGPYDDGFSEQQHKYGPYLPILAARKQVRAQEKNRRSNK
jgi:thiosulfate dehydrogenase